MINVMGYFGDRGACRAYRLLYPFSRVGKHCADKFKMHLSGHIEDRRGKHLTKYDIVVLQRQYSPEVFIAVQKMKLGGSKLIYEIDDAIVDGLIPSWNPASKDLSSQSVQKGIKAFLALCDAVFVTNQEMKDVYKKYNNNIFILPNSLDLNRFTPSAGLASKKVVLWQGSGTHEKDLKILGDSLEQLAATPGVFVKVWGGHTVKGSYQVPPVPFEAFYQTLSQIDAHIGIAPLIPCVFNRCKSNLKFLEYTAQGMVTVASAVGPYKETISEGETGLLVSDNRSWYDRVMELVSNPNLMSRILANAKDLINEKYNIDKNYKLWADALEEVYNQRKD